jgi:signal transduction histidine kinase
VTLSRATIAGLAPPSLENLRPSRYRSDEQAIDLGRLAPADRPVVLAIYAMLGELAEVVGVDGALDDPAPLLAFVARYDVSALLYEVRGLGAANPEDKAVAEVLHDIRGGALTTLFVQLARLGRIPYKKELAVALFLATRDQRKMMRNVVRDLDAVARVRDLAPRPHSLGEVARALREFTATMGDERVVVTVDCASDAVIAESCVECAAIDRVAYNLLNNAVRYADRPSIDAWLLTLEHDLRVAIANPIAAEQRAIVSEQLAADPGSLFGSFTTSGSGHGLRIVSDLVGRAYGVASAKMLVDRGYVGATIVEDRFVTWFHWPLAGA